MALFALSDLDPDRQMDSVRASLARALATGVVEAHVGQPVESTAVTQTLRVDLDAVAIDLPRRPVTAVASVSVDGTALAVDDWEWNPGRSRVWLRAVPSWSGREPVAEVAYTAGWTAVPEAIRAVALSVARRIYSNPDGLRSVSIDDYSETRAGADDDLAGLALLKGERAILDRFRRGRAASVSTW